VTDRFTYRRGARLPGITLYWDDDDGNPIDFQAVGHTFVVTLVPDDGGSNVTCTASVTGGVGTVTIAWSAADLDQPAGRYVLKVAATEIASTKRRDFNPDASPVIQIVE
jgi:hypothetical protein